MALLLAFLLLCTPFTVPKPTSQSRPALRSPVQPSPTPLLGNNLGLKRAITLYLCLPLTFTCSTLLTVCMFHLLL